MTIQELHAADAVRSPRCRQAHVEFDGLFLPYEGETRMRLTLCSGLADAHVYVDPQATDLLAVDWGDGPPARLRVSASELRLSWPATLGSWFAAALAGGYRDIDIVLHPAVEWTLQIRGGLACVEADLTSGKLTGLDVSGGASAVRLDLPAPAGLVPLRISGGVSDLGLRRPADTAVALAVRGGISGLSLDEQRFDALGGGVRLSTGAVHGDAPGYALEITGGASELHIVPLSDSLSGEGA